MTIFASPSFVSLIPNERYYLYIYTYTRNKGIHGCDEGELFSESRLVPTQSSFMRRDESGVLFSISNYDTWWMACVEYDNPADRIDL